MYRAEVDCDLAALGVVDAAESHEFDKFVELAQALTGAEISLVSIVQPDRDRQFFTAHRGLPAEFAAARETPLSHSFCLFVQRSESSLVVENAPLDDRVRDNPAIRDLGVVAYLGAPIPGPDGSVLGALCVIETKPRRWTEGERLSMERAAACVGDLVAARAAKAKSEAALRVAEAAEAAKDRLLTRVSHELRTPLNGVLGVAALLEPMMATEKEQRLLRVIKESGVLLLHLTEDILDWSRLSDPSLRLESEPVDIARLAKEAGALHQVTAGAKGLAFSVEVDPPFPEARLGDRVRLLQVVHNIVGNAVKFTRAGGIRLRFSAPDGGPLVIEAEDDGPGVPPEERERVFEEFFRGAGVGQEGVGLGLPIVRRLAHSMGGEAVLLPAPCGGALARVTLPLEPVTLPLAC